jgi:hypothetical protein
MKLKTILLEIGDRVIYPNANYTLNDYYNGSFDFDLKTKKYTVDIEVVDTDYVEDDPSLEFTQLSLIIDFMANDDGDYEMTNENIPLLVMSNIVGGVEIFLKKYITKFNENQPLLLKSIKFIGKDETGEEVNDTKRDRLYKIVLSNFAKRFGTTASFKISHYTEAKFNPYIKLNDKT